MDMIRKVLKKIYGAGMLCSWGALMVYAFMVLGVTPWLVLVGIVGFLASFLWPLAGLGAWLYPDVVNLDALRELMLRLPRLP